MLSEAISNATDRHKDIAKKLIHASNKEITVEIKSETSSSVSGSSMFGDMETSDPEETVGPFKTIWTDADSVRSDSNTREAAIIDRYTPVEVVAKFWLEDVLLDTDDPYGETYFDKATKVISDSKSYHPVGYDRYGLGTAKNPYIISVALRGGVGQNG